MSSAQQHRINLRNAIPEGATRILRTQVYKMNEGYFAGVPNSAGFAYRIERNGRTWYGTVLCRKVPPGYGDGLMHYLVAFVLPNGDIFEAMDGIKWNSTADEYLNRWTAALLSAEDDGSDWPEGVAAEMKARTRQKPAIPEWIEWEDGLDGYSDQLENSSLEN